jgi:hypothetical protein
MVSAPSDTAYCLKASIFFKDAELPLSRRNHRIMCSKFYQTGFFVKIIPATTTVKLMLIFNLLIINNKIEDADNMSWVGFIYRGTKKGLWKYDKLNYSGTKKAVQTKKGQAGKSLTL